MSIEEQLEYIKNNYLAIPVKTIARNIGRSCFFVKGRMDKMGLVVPKNIIEKRKRESRFSKGSIPFNKGLKQTEFLTLESIE